MSVPRRSFLKIVSGGSALAVFGGSVPTFLARTAASVPAGGEEPILVVVELPGGNDGLNTLVPYEDDIYARSRPTLHFTEKQVISVADGLGLHPVMPRFADMLQDGTLEIVQGVGYPNPVQDHQRAMEVWQTAVPTDDTCQTGWLGRTGDAMAAAKPGTTVSASVGSSRVPLTLNGRHVIAPRLQPRAMARPALPRLSQDTQLAAAVEKTLAVPRGSNHPAEYVRTLQLRTIDDARRVVASFASPAGEYPDFQLAADLRAVAGLIRAEPGIRVYYVTMGGGGIGGFDTHANQAGNHGALLRQLSESVAAFAADLRRSGLLDRVALFTFSEFGRTLAENGRRGTDHGAAACMFVAGGRVRQPLVGPRPDLSRPEQGGVPHSYDFRQVYATMLEKWLGVDSVPILGDRFESLDLFA